MIDGKGIAALVLAKRPPQRQEDDDAESDRFSDAASEILSAVSGKDPLALADSLRAFVSMCSYSAADDEG